MPDPSTTRLALYKSKSDGSEVVSYTQDIGQNLDKLDAAVGALACTSTTRPSSPYNGQFIRETDTNRVWVSNGSAPASGSWREISTATTLQTFTAGIALTRTNATDIAIATATAAAAQRMFGVGADGKLNWGSGSAVEDTNLYRSGVNALTTDDSLTVGINLSVTGNLTVGGIGKVLFVRKTADTNSTSGTGTDDPHLTVSLVAGAVYELSGRLYLQTTDTTNADFAMTFTTQTSTGGYWDISGPNQTSTTDSTSTRTIATPFGAGARTFGAISGSVIPLILGGIVRPTVSGAFAVNWNRAGASGTVTLSADSWMELTRVA